MSLCLCTDSPADYTKYFIIIAFDEDLGSEKEKARESLFFFYFYLFLFFHFVGASLVVRASLVAHLVKNLLAMQENLGSIPGSRRSPGEGNGYPLQYSCLDNPMDGGAWWATVHGVTKSQT